jgi:hypothetical protein
MGLGNHMFTTDLVKVYLDMTKEMKDLEEKFLMHKIPTLSSKQL